MKETRTEIKAVLIEEKYFQENGIVYREWRFQGQPWNIEETAFKELPWIEVKFDQ